MKAHKDTHCKLCDREVKDGSEIHVLPIHGRYHDICPVCWRQIYSRVANIIIKKINE